MNINDFLSPIALDKKDTFFTPDESSFISNIKVNTTNSPIVDLEGVKMVIIGIPESRGSDNRGSEEAPDAIRNKLYQLKYSPKNNKEKIFDIGNLKPGNNLTDTYYGLKEILNYLLKNNITVVLLGGTQDTTIGGVMSLNSLNIPVYLTTIDSKIDYSTKSEFPKSLTYLHELLESENYKIQNYSNIGHQIYLNDFQILEKFYKKQYDCIRLGDAKKEMLEIEPTLRDSSIVSFDFTSTKQGDAPGHYNPSPNGFIAEEACVLSRYAGLSENLRLFGVFEINPSFDKNSQTSHLAAQSIWYFIDGYFNRFNEVPQESNQNFKKFIVELNNSIDSLTFYRSQKSNRWWMEIKNDSNQNSLIACSYKDYQTTCNNEIPNKWLKYTMYSK